MHRLPLQSSSSSSSSSYAGAAAAAEILAAGRITVAPNNRRLILSSDVLGRRGTTTTTTVAAMTSTDGRISATSRKSLIYFLQQARQHQQQRQLHRQGLQPTHQYHQHQSSLAFGEYNATTANGGGISTVATSTIAQIQKEQQCRQMLSWQQVQSLFWSAAVPMVGFGFMDQVVMITIGSHIDQTLGVQLGLATMTAAAMGQVVSDTCGVLFGGTLERLLKVAPPAPLSAAQQQLPLVSRIKLAGAVAGVVAGCTLGALSLLLLPSEDRNSQEDDHSQGQAQELLRLHAILHNAMTCPEDMWLRHGAHCTLHIKSDDVKWQGTAMTNSNGSNGSGAANIVTGLEKADGPVQQCLESGDAVLYDHVMYLPVKDVAEPNFIAVLQVEASLESFAIEDMEGAKQLARHIGYFMNPVM